MIYGVTYLSVSQTRKKKPREYDDELSADMSREERKQHKKACRASKKGAREKST